jgi:cytochrome d ubiquinol oxidase subunit II
LTPVVLAALVGLAALVLYAVFGGADFGGGVWDLLAWGPRAKAQRDAISDTIGPVWESNHVWLIFAIVILFTCFPPAFADIATGLNAPLCFALVGIVMRGSAFVFRNYATESPALVGVWAATFGVASLITPFWFGDAIGALATGRYAWLSPFALSTGVFAVAVCAQMAAIFLVRESTMTRCVKTFAGAESSRRSLSGSPACSRR